MSDTGSVSLMDLDFATLIESDDPYSVTYTPNNSETNPIQLEIKVSENEDEEIFYIYEEHFHLKVISQDLQTGRDKLIQYIGDNYIDPDYTIRENYTDGELTSIDLVRDGSTIIFTVGEGDVSYSSIEENPVSIKFWSNLVTASEQLSDELEKINGHSISIEGYRVPVNMDLSKSNQSLIAHISKYMIYFYKDNNVLASDDLLHQLFTYAYHMTGYDASVSNQLVYSDA